MGIDAIPAIASGAILAGDHFNGVFGFGGGCFESYPAVIVVVVCSSWHGSWLVAYGQCLVPSS